MTILQTLFVILAAAGTGIYFGNKQGLPMLGAIIGMGLVGIYFGLGVR
jgi:hypothetical protein